VPFGRRHCFSTGNLKCRDENDGPCLLPNSQPTVNFTVAIDDTELCSSPDLDATQDLQFELDSFEDAEFTTPQTIFSVGSQIYMALSVSDTSTIDGISVSKVRLYSGTAAGEILYQVSSGVVTYPAAVYDAEFNFTVMESVQTPGYAMSTGFTFILTRNLPTLATVVDPEVSTAVISIEVDFDISFHGNAKRSLRSLVTRRATEVGREVHHLTPRSH